MQFVIECDGLKTHDVTKTIHFLIVTRSKQDNVYQKSKRLHFNPMPFI
jgi:hypothetical protein